MNILQSEKIHWYKLPPVFTYGHAIFWIKSRVWKIIMSYDNSEQTNLEKGINLSSHKIWNVLQVVKYN